MAGKMAEEQERRLTQRNPERVEIFQKMLIPREEFYFEAYRVKEKSDVVMEMGGEMLYVLSFVTISKGDNT